MLTDPSIAGTVGQHLVPAAIMLGKPASKCRHLPEIVARDLARIIGILTAIPDCLPAVLHPVNIDRKEDFAREIENLV